MIDISGRCENGIIILQVQDNGTGMDADTMKEILKPKKQGKRVCLLWSRREQCPGTHTAGLWS